MAINNSRQLKGWRWQDQRNLEESIAVDESGNIAVQGGKNLEVDGNITADGGSSYIGSNPYGAGTALVLKGQGKSYLSISLGDAGSSSTAILKWSASDGASSKSVSIDTLADAASKSYVTTALAPYAKKTDLATYATTASVNTLLASYQKKVYRHDIDIRSAYRGTYASLTLSILSTSNTPIDSFQDLVLVAKEGRFLASGAYGDNVIRTVVIGSTLAATYFVAISLTNHTDAKYAFDGFAAPVFEDDVKTIN